MDNDGMITKKGFMGHNDDRFRFPGSRDFMMDQPVCLATDCICNTGGYCFAPSRVKLDGEGRCTNYKPKQKKKNPNIRGL